MPREIAAPPDRLKVAPLPDGFLENELEQHKRRLCAAEVEVENARNEVARARRDVAAAQDDAAAAREARAALQHTCATTQEQLDAARARLSRMTCYAVVWAALAVGGAAVATVCVKHRVQGGAARR
jgi:hypothetical protein